MSLLNNLMQMIGDYFNKGKEKSKLGDVELDIISEKSRTMSATVTNRRVEKGFNIADTVRKEAMLINITVVDNSNQKEFNRKSLEQMLEAGEPVLFYYAGRDKYENIVIESIEEIEDYTKKDCFTYYIVLRQITVAEIKSTDVKTDYKKAKSTGGKKRRTTAKVKGATNTEKAKIEAKGKEKERGKSSLKQLGGLVG